MTTTRPRRLRGELRGAFFVAVFLLAPHALAQPAAGPAPDHNQVFKEGLEHYQAGRDAEAIRVWDELLADLGEQRGWKILYNLGLAYERSGDATKALDSFERFLRVLVQRPEELTADLDARRQDAAKRVELIRTGHGELVVRPPPGGEEVWVRVGAAPPRKAGFSVWLPPGLLVVETHVRTSRPRSEQVELEAGRRTELAVEPVEEPAPEPPKVEPEIETVRPQPRSPAPLPDPGADRPVPRGFPVVPVVVGAAGTVVTTAIPIGLRFRAARKRDRASELGTGHSEYAGRVDEFERARTAYYVSYAIPAAVALATTGVVVAHYLRREGSPRVGVAAAPAPGGGGIWLNGAF